MSTTSKPFARHSGLSSVRISSRVEEPVVGIGLDLELVPPRLLAADLGVVTADPERERDPVRRAGGAEVRALEDLAQAFGCGGGHQYFRSMGT